MAPLRAGVALALCWCWCWTAAASSSPPSGVFAAWRVSRWASAAWRQVWSSSSCPERGGLLGRPQCQRLSRLVSPPGRGPAVYVSAPAPPGRKLRALLPDGAADRPPAHDALLLLDPSPDAAFGHPLLLFYLDFGLGPPRCRGPHRFYLGE